MLKLKVQAVILLMGLFFSQAKGIEVGLTPAESLPVTYDVTQMEYAPDYDLIFLREGSTAIHVIDVYSGYELSLHTATEQFTDMDISPDGRYLFVADYGGEAMGYGTPLHPHYVHRYDIELGTWKIAQAPQIAWKIEAISADRILLQEHDQWIDITLNSFGNAITELARTSADYYGDMEYDWRNGRVYHGNSGSSSHEIDVIQVNGDTLVNIGSTGIYGTADSGGGTSVLSSDGLNFYYGRLQVEAANITNNRITFPETIYAASSDLAFGPTKYYYAHTGVAVGTLGFSSTVYNVSDDGHHLWGYRSQPRAVLHYNIGVSSVPGPMDLFVEGPAGVAYNGMAQFKAVALYEDGTTLDVTNGCTWSISQAIFGNIDQHGLLSALNRPGDITITASFSQAGKVVSKQKVVQCIFGYGEQGVVEKESFSIKTSVLQMVYSSGYEVLFIRQDSAILVLDAATRQIIDTHMATNKFSDMDLTSDGRYLFAADYGGEATGYGTPLRPHYVHRYDIELGTWMIAQAPQIAWKIEGISADRVLLQEYDQWIDITLNSFGNTMTELSRIAADYYGDMEYDWRTNKIFHGNSGSSSQEIDVLQRTNDALTHLGSTGTYGSAQGYGGSSILSTNGAYFCYGRLQVSTSNISTNLHVFPQMIWAATDNIAFGESRYFDANTGIELSGLGFITKIYAVSDDGKHLWAYQALGEVLHHYLISPLKINAVVINNGVPQRSNVFSLALKFNRGTNIPSLIASGEIKDVIKLYKIANPVVPQLWLDESRFEWHGNTNELVIDLTSDGMGGTNLSKLVDGRYHIKMETSLIRDEFGNELLDGDGILDGFLTINHSTDAAIRDFFKFFGDADGDADVDFADLSKFTKTYNKSSSDPLFNSIFDSEGDGDVDFADLFKFRKNYQKTLP